MLFVCIFCFFAHPGWNCQDCIGKPGRCLNTIRSSLAQGSITMPKPSHSRSSSNEPALGKELFLQVWPILSRWIVQNDLGAVPASLALWWEMAVGRHHGQAVGRHGQAHSSLEPIDRTATDFMPPLVMEAWQCVHHWMSEVIEARKVVAADRFFKRHLLHHAFSAWGENTDSDSMVPTVDTMIKMQRSHVCRRLLRRQTRYSQTLRHCRRRSRRSLPLVLSLPSAALRARSSAALSLPSAAPCPIGVIARLRSS